jgi:hypothetical protein
VPATEKVVQWLMLFICIEVFTVCYCLNASTTTERVSAL